MGTDGPEQRPTRLNLSPHQQSALFGALGFALAFTLNAVFILIFSRLQFAVALSQIVSSTQLFDKLLAGLLAGLGLIGLSGAAAGWVGATFLEPKLPDLKLVNFRRRSAVSFGAAEAILFLPLLLFTALVGYYDRSLVQEPLEAMFLFTIYGIVFGLVSGIFLTLRVFDWRSGWRIIFGMISGFAAGGFAAGFIAWMWLAGHLSWLPGFLILVPAFMIFGLAGGAGLGFMMYRVGTLERAPSPGKPRRVWLVKAEKVLGAVLTGILLFGAVNALYLLQVRYAPLNEIISLPTIGTHFSDMTVITAQASSPSVFSDQNGRPFLTWHEDNDIYLGRLENGTWTQPVNVSNSEAQATHPQGLATSDGAVLLTWSEEGVILTSQCTQSGCTAPQIIVSPACATGKGDMPTLAIDSAGTIMIAWASENDQVAYALLNESAQGQGADTGCVAEGRNPRLAASGSDGFHLVYEGMNDQVFLVQFNGQWLTPGSVGQGHSPDLIAGRDGQADAAWCNDHAQLSVLSTTGEQTILDFPSCQSRPALAHDGRDQLHLVWVSEQVENNSGFVERGSPTLYETVLNDDGFTAPTVVSTATAAEQPSLAADTDGILHLAWKQDGLAYASQPFYSCEDIAPQTAAGRRVLQALSRPEFHPPDQPVPYCQNRYDTLLFTPNPNPAFSNQPPQIDSAFTYMGDIMQTAEYEALFATMQWVPDENEDSPGLVISQGVAALYEKVKTNPAAYPRGMTVRILLGNMPAFNVFRLNNQVWNVLADLRDAGVTEMVNEEIGWRVQVANYSGLWPHSHAKLMVIDGKTAVSKGINVSYLHYPVDNPSGRGLSMVDYGMVATGPVAQHTLASYDDLWNGSDEVVCDNMNPIWDKLWLVTCDRVSAVPDHTPETLKFYIPQEANDIVFSQYRSRIHFASDEAVLAALSSAEKSLDIFEVNFTLEVLCEAGIVFIGICDYENNALPFMRALVEVVEKNRIPVRIMVEEEAMDGAENRVGIQAFVAELEQRGLSEYVDIHFYNGKMHAKGFIVDDAFLVVGSQNFQYSAWGDMALNEYNLSTENSEAIQIYKGSFDYYWSDSTPVSEVMRFYP